MRVQARDDAMDGLTTCPDALDLVGSPGGLLWWTTRERVELARPHDDVPAKRRAAGTPRRRWGRNRSVSFGPSGARRQNRGPAGT